MEQTIMIEIYGVKGADSKPFRKLFKSEEQLDKWMEKNADDVEIYGRRDTTN